MWISILNQKCSYTIYGRCETNRLYVCHTLVTNSFWWILNGVTISIEWSWGDHEVIETSREWSWGDFDTLAVEFVVMSCGRPVKFLYELHIVRKCSIQVCMKCSSHGFDMYSQQWNSRMWMSLSNASEYVKVSSAYAWCHGRGCLTSVMTLMWWVP